MPDKTLPLLPSDFLAVPNPNVKTTRIDFANSALPENKGRYAVIIDNVLSPAECTTLLRAAEATAPQTGWERAQVNIGGGRQMLITDARNCGRIIWDSRDVVAKIWGRISTIPEVQEIARLENVPGIFGNGPAMRNEVWEFTRPNERMRFLKYVGGEYFRPHCDGVYETPDRKERSYFTLHLYLSDAGVVTEEEEAKEMSAEERADEVQEVLVGGATTFHSLNFKKQIDVMPKVGRILLFQHRDLIHSGDDVVSGVKYTMRTDLMYTLSDEKAAVQGKWPTVQMQKLQDAAEGTDGLAEAKAYGYI